MSAVTNLRSHWPEYLIEAWALGTFMLSAGFFTMLIEYPGSPVHQLLPDAGLRRALIGIAMGMTAITLIYSRWGKRSGAHMNPAVTLTFLRLKKVSGWDALFFIVAQFIGGTAGVFLLAALAGSVFTAPPVNFVATLPGPQGVLVAFSAEFAISFGLMLMILFVSNSTRVAGYTGLFAGLLVATYITVEGPLSGMSINPARSFASAAPAALWAELWIYFTAPILGMLSASEAYLRLRGRARVKCAKLMHTDDVRCIHCGYEPPAEPVSSHVTKSAPPMPSQRLPG